MKITTIIRYEPEESGPLTGDEIVEAINTVARELGPDHELRLHGDHGQTYKVEGYRSTTQTRERLPQYDAREHVPNCRQLAAVQDTITCRCVVPSGKTFRVKQS